MHPLPKIFLTGMFISFLGSLPMGTLNVAAMQIGITDGYTAAILFSLGSLLVEMIYVRVSLVGMDWISKQEKIFKVLEWVTLAIVVALAVSSFHAALHPKSGKNIILSSTLPRFILGATMCAVNPVQIPFWFGWSTVLFRKESFVAKNSHYNLYILGIGIGTLIGNLCFHFWRTVDRGKIEIKPEYFKLGDRRHIHNNSIDTNLENCYEEGCSS